MSTLASTLLDFILELFKDPEKAAEYEADPQGTLDAAGLSDATPEDVAALLPIVTDHSTVGGWGGRDSCDDDRDGVAGGRRPDRDDDDRDHHGYRPARQDDDRDHHGYRPARQDDDRDHHDHHDGGHHHGGLSPAAGSETVVITHLQHIQYSNTETHVSLDASHSIWVSGDAQAIFGEVEGDVIKIDNENGVVAGDDLEVDGDLDVDVDNSDRSINDSFNVEDSFNPVQSNNDIDGDGVIGNGNEVGNTEVEVSVEDSPINLGGNQAVDSFNGNDIGSHNEDNDVIADRGGQVGDNTTVDDVTVVNDSFNGNDLSEDNDGVDDSFNGNEFENIGNDNSDNSTNTDVDAEVDIEDSFNEDNSTTTEVEVEFEDSFNEDNSTTTEVEESFNDNAVAVDDSTAIA